MSYNSQSWSQDILVKAIPQSTASITLTGSFPLGYIPLTAASPTLAQLSEVGAINLTSTGNLSAINFTITGLTLTGETISEVLAGPNATTINSVLNTYWRITSIVPSATSGSTLSGGDNIDSTGILNGQSVVANTPMNITASTFGSAASITLAVPMFVSVTSAGDETANTFTFHGLDANNNLSTVTIAGANTSTASTTIAFKRIDWVSQLVDDSANISLGNIGQTATGWVPLDKNSNQFTVGFGVALLPGTTLEYTVQYAYISPVLGITLIQNDSILANQTASGTTFLNEEPFDAARVFISSYTDGEALFMVRPTGLATAGYPPIQV